MIPNIRGRHNGDRRIFIFEGPDCAGKTTLIDGLGKHFADQGFSVEILHNGSLPDILTGSLLSNHYRNQLKFDQDDDRRIVRLIDRSWLSEFVYGELYRKFCRLSVKDMFDIQRAEVEAGAVTVMLDLNRHILEDRYIQRADQEYVKDLAIYRQIVEAYAVINDAIGAHQSYPSCAAAWLASSLFHPSTTISGIPPCPAELAGILSNMFYQGDFQCQ